jgi:riboflavin kinase / FMN adenylyltransferase
MKNDLSSPQILAFLESGNVRKYEELTGTAYRIHGLVVHGDHIGRTFGFPTANLKLPERTRFLPAHGVYAVRAVVGDSLYNGMANAGIRPTFEGKKLTVEIHLFDFKGDLYGKRMDIIFVDRIRDEKKFSSIDELVNQIRQDKTEALKLLT